MSKNNRVHKILVTKGNQDILTVNKHVTDLQPGQIGVFDAITNLSISQVSDSRGYYLAVGLDKDGDGIIDDVSKSRGTRIQSGNEKYFTFRPHTPGRNMKVKFKNYTVECDGEYGLKFDFKNSEIYRIMGYTPFVKTFVGKATCCKTCPSFCQAGDPNKITRDLFVQISNDNANIIDVDIVPRGDVSAAGVTPVNNKLTLADLDKIIAFNATKTNTSEFVLTDLVFETNPVKTAKFCGINLNHFFPRETFMTISKVGNFNCSGEIEVLQEAVIEEGNGYDIREMEYRAMGHDDSYYRVSSVTGMPKEFDYNTEINTKYDLIHLGYDEASNGAWLEYSYGEGTTIAIPSKDTTTRDCLLRALNIKGFDSLVDDAQLANTDPSVVETTSAINDVNKDGLA